MSSGPTLRERVLAVLVAVLGLLALLAAGRADNAVYAVVGLLWLGAAFVLWRVTGTWLVLGLALFAAGFGALALLS